MKQRVLLVGVLVMVGGGLLYLIFHPLAEQYRGFLGFFAQLGDDDGTHVVYFALEALGAGLALGGFGISLIALGTTEDTLRSWRNRFGGDKEDDVTDNGDGEND
jgi:hypothetical protein